MDEKDKTLIPYSNREILADFMKLLPLETQLKDESLFGITSELEYDKIRIVRDYLKVIHMIETIQDLQDLAERKKNIFEYVQKRHPVKILYDDKKVNSQSFASFKQYIPLLRNRLAHVGFSMNDDEKKPYFKISATDADLPFEDRHFKFTIDDIYTLYWYSMELYQDFEKSMNRIGKNINIEQPYTDKYTDFLRATAMSDIYVITQSRLHDMLGEEIKQSKNKAIFGQIPFEEFVKDDELYKVLMDFVKERKCTLPAGKTNAVEIVFDMVRYIRDASIHPGKITKEGDEYVLNEEITFRLTKEDIMKFGQALIATKIPEFKYREIEVPEQNLNMEAILNSQEVLALKANNKGAEIGKKIAEMKQKQKDTIEANRQAMIERIKNGDKKVLGINLENYDFLTNKEIPPVENE